MNFIVWILAALVALVVPSQCVQFETIPKIPATVYKQQIKRFVRELQTKDFSYEAFGYFSKFQQTRKITGLARLAKRSDQIAVQFDFTSDHKYNQFSMVTVGDRRFQWLTSESGIICWKQPLKTSMPSFLFGNHEHYASLGFVQTVLERYTADRKNMIVFKDINHHFEAYFARSFDVNAIPNLEEVVVSSGPLSGMRFSFIKKVSNVPEELFNIPSECDRATEQGPNVNEWAFA